MMAADGVNEMAARIATRFGEVQGPDAEVRFKKEDLKTCDRVC
jgi:hypothetical protein